MSSLQFPKKKRGKGAGAASSTPPPTVGAPSQANLAARAARMAHPSSPHSPVVSQNKWYPPRPRPNSSTDFAVGRSGELDDYQVNWTGWGKSGPDSEALNAEKARDERLKSALKGVKDRPMSEPSVGGKGKQTKGRRNSSSLTSMSKTKKSKDKDKDKDKEKSRAGSVSSTGSNSNSRQSPSLASPKKKRVQIPRYPTLQSSEHRVVPAGTPIDDGGMDSAVYRKLLEETTTAAEQAMNELVSGGSDFEKQLIGQAQAQTQTYGKDSQSRDEIEIEMLKRLNQKSRESYQYQNPSAPVGSRTQIYAPRESYVDGDGENGKGKRGGIGDGEEAVGDGNGGEGSGKGNDNEGDASNLVTVMATRLNKLERLVRRLNTELAEKDTELKALRRERSPTSASTSASDPSQVRHLQRSNDRLRRELKSVHGFLADYGLTWVGDPESDPDVDGGVTRDEDKDKRKSKGKGKGGGGVKGRVSHIVDEGEGEGEGGRRGSVQWGGNVSPRSPYRKESSDSPNFNFEQEKNDNDNSNYHYDARAVLQRIKELNILAGDGTTAFKKSADGRTHKLQPPTSISLILYKDGIFLRSGPFRPICEMSTRIFLTDVLDGFFPFELKKEYPDGVVFNVTDRTQDVYSESKHGSSQAAQVFPGTGQVLGGDGSTNGGDGDVKKPISVRVSVRENDSLGNGGNAPPPPSTIHQLTDQVKLASESRVHSSELIAKLPETVVRGGRLVKVREGVDDLLRGRANEEPRVVQMDESDMNIARQGEGGGGGGGEGEGETKKTTLRVKSADLSAVYVIRLPYTATIGDMRTALSIQLEREGGDNDSENDNGNDFEIRSTFPPVSYIEHEKTLEECGLVPSAVLFMKDVK